MVINACYSGLTAPFPPVHNFERAKEVLSFHASRLWRATSSDKFEFVCGKILIITDIVSKRIAQHVPSGGGSDPVHPELSIDELKADDADSSFLLHRGTSINSYQTNEQSLCDLPNQSARNTRISRNPSKDDCGLLDDDDGQPHLTMTYSNPFDDRLFDGFAGLLNFCLIGSQLPSCNVNLFIDKDNSIRLIESNLLGYRLFLMIPMPFGSSFPLPVESRQVKDNETAKILSSPELLLDLASLPEQIAKLWEDNSLQLLWLNGNECEVGSGEGKRSGGSGGTSQATTKPSEESTVLHSRISSVSTPVEMLDLKTDISPTEKSSSEGSSELASPLFSKTSSFSYQSLRTCSRTCTEELASTCSEVHNISEEKELFDYFSNKSAAEDIECNMEKDAEEEVEDDDDYLSRKAEAVTMNPLAKPFVFNSDTSSCEQFITTDQLLSNNSYGYDESIEEQYCTSFFPSMSYDGTSPPAPAMSKDAIQSFEYLSSLNSAKIGRPPPGFTVGDMSCPPPPCYPSASIQRTHLQPPHFQMTNPEGVNHPVFMAPTPIQPPSAPVFMNAMPPQCAWVPTQPVIVRPMQPGIISTPIFRQGVPPAQPQVIVQQQNQIPMYVVPSSLNQHQLCQVSNQQPNSNCGPLLTSRMPTPPNHANSINVSQKEQIQSAVDLMKYKTQTLNSMLSLTR